MPPVQGAASRTVTLPQNEDFAITRFRGKNGPCPQGQTCGHGEKPEKLPQHELLQILPVGDVELLHSGGEVPLHRVGGDAEVGGDLLVGPPSGGQHGDGELRGGEVIGHVVACLWVVDFSPPGGKAVGDGDDPLEILRPGGFDLGLQHAPQQAVVLPEALDEVVGLGQGPGGQEVGSGLFGLLQAHVIHHRHQVEVEGGDGVGRRPHGQRPLHQAGTGAVLPFQVEVVGLDIQGEGPQPLRQKGEEVLGIRQPLRQGEVEEHRPRRCHKGRGCLELGGSLPCGGQGGAQLPQGELGPADLPDGEVGIGIDQAGGQPGPHVVAVQVGLGLLGGLLGVAGEVVVLSQGDVPPGAGGHGLHRRPAPPREKGGVYQGHQVGGVQLSARGRRPLRQQLVLLGDLGLGRPGGDGPEFPKLFGPGDAALGAELLHRPKREVPCFGGFPHGKVVHVWPSWSLIFCLFIICAYAHGCKGQGSCLMGNFFPKGFFSLP